jgi:urease accessory protein
LQKNNTIQINNSVALLSLLHLTDATLPIGGFSHSAGLETYVQLKMVHNKLTATTFITQMLSRNILYTDAALVSLAFDAIEQNQLDALLTLDELCTAVKLPMEIRQASQKLGNRLLKIFYPSYTNIISTAFKNAIDAKQIHGNYCIVFALIAYAMKIEKQQALTGFFYNAATAFVTNSVKLVPLGQQDGQQILIQLLPIIEQLVQQSVQPNKDLIGMCCTGFDIRCMQHEQLYSRLYMS